MPPGTATVIMAMVMITTIPTRTDVVTTDGALLQLIWLASPALPVGAFSYSEGLEAAVDSGAGARRGHGPGLAASTSCCWRRRAASWPSRPPPRWPGDDDDHGRIGALNDWVRQPAKVPSSGCRPSRPAAR